MTELGSDKDKIKFGLISIEKLKETDIDDLEYILRQHIRHYQTGEVMQNEIDDIKKYMRGGIDEYGRTRKYFVAKDSEGKILGCMGFTEPDPDLIKHYDTNLEESVELVNAFVSSNVFRGGGVGLKLFNAICDIAKKEGKKQILLSSGPRYRGSWGFYDKVSDTRGDLLIDKFGPTRHAPTWIKNL